MLGILKNTAKRLLAARGYEIQYNFRHRIGGRHLEDDLRVLVQRNAPVCFDVGANEGQTIDFLDQTFHLPRIHAFEPSAGSFQKLRARGCPARISLHPCALGDRITRQEFIHYESSVLSSFLPLAADRLNPFQDTPAQNREPVEITTADAFAARHGIDRIDLFKTDTQGYDLKVLQGAEGLLREGRIDNVLIELNFIRMYENQGNPHEIMAFLAGHRLHLVDLYEKVRQGHILGWCNALFTRPPA